VFQLNLVPGGIFNAPISDNGGVLDNQFPVEDHLANAFKGPDRFLGLTVTRTPSGVVDNPEEISPRQRLLTAPFAFDSEMAHRAPDSFTIGGKLTVAQGATVSNGVYLQSGNLTLSGRSISYDGTRTGLTVTAAGRVGIGTTNPAAALHVAGRIHDKTGEVIPVGMVLPFAGVNDAPKGWLFCNGAAVSRTSYADLYSIIGTTCGTGDGYSTFNLPDLRGRVPVGAGTGSSLTTRTLGEKIGEEAHTLTVDEIPPHAHTYNVSDRQNYGYHLSSGPNDGVNKGRDTNRTTPAGGSKPHNNMQPSLVLNYIIKY
jgi:microcystin-dependent protein